MIEAPLPDQFTTAHLLLRRPRGSDALATFVGWTSDVVATRHLPWRRHTELAHAEAYLASLAAKWEDGSAYAWLTTVRPDDRAMGLGLIRLREAEAEIGYAIAPAHSGKGLATEVASALLSQAFAVPGVERAIAVLDAEHAASVRVLEKVGMVLVEEFTDDVSHPNISDVPRPCWRFAVGRDRWAAGGHTGLSPRP